VSIGRPLTRVSPPLQPAPAQSWLELFYDLTFVASIVVLSSAYSKDSTWDNVLWLVLVLSLIWATWLSTTLLLNRIELAGTWLRSLLVVQMVLILVLALTADASKEDSSSWSGPVFAAALVTLALQYLAVTRSRPDLRRYFSERMWRCLAAAVVFAFTPLYPDPWYVIPWVLGIGLMMAPVRQVDHHDVEDDHHVIHRFGEFTIIMLGEAFVKVGLVASEEPLDEVDLVGLPMTFVLVFAIWWLYFTDIPASGLPRARRRRVGWMYAHFPLHISITAVAVGMSRLLLPSLEGRDAQSIRYVTLPLTVIALSLALLNLMIDTPLALRRARIHLLSAALLIVVWVVLFGFDSYDLEGTALAVMLVLAWSGFRIRRLPADPEPATVR
jgi:low temperature requirement protein LtrA